MKIGIDARTIRNSGIGRYVQNICQGLAALANNHELTLFVPPGVRREEFSENFHLIPEPAGIYSLGEQLGFRSNIVHVAPDIMFFPHYAAPVFKPVRSVSCIHDLIHLLFPGQLPNKAAWFYAKIMISAAIHTSDKIVTVSEHTRRDLMKFYPKAADKIKVIYNGVSDIYQPAGATECLRVGKKFHLAGRYILYVGLQKPHKNLERLLKAFALLLADGQFSIGRQRVKLGKEQKNRLNGVHPEASEPNGLQLVLAGKEEKHSAVLRRLVRDLGLENKVRFLGYVEEADLPGLYTGAEVFVFPSLYEGFGLPPLEAMACGTPVVTSNAASLPEVVGDAGVMVGPTDTEALAAALAEFCQSAELREKYSAKGKERAKAFSWSRAAMETLTVLESVLDKR